ncbi:ATPase [Tateyamaria omphalii]|uniref:ATPase n=1 Tax=Tateyamaria omphalii TaxID=299262 RepID=A0A1P8N113_9RHOB|nr:ATPase [Tateyamaria omphalii]
MHRFFVISGCSGGGKSTLLDALAARGFATVSEPGRRIVAEERQGDGKALPWVDPAAFANRAVAMARQDLDAAAAHTGPVFFDRGLIDAAVGLHRETGTSFADTIGPVRPYAPLVFLAPPWPEIYKQDADRQHSLDTAMAEYARLENAYAQLGYQQIHLPKTSPAQRVTFVLDRLAMT